jgi:hypothetical protein
MSADPELTEQMPWVHTSDGRDVLEAIHQKTGMSRAAIMRYAYARTRPTGWSVGPRPGMIQPINSRLASSSCSAFWTKRTAS